MSEIVEMQVTEEKAAGMEEMRIENRVMLTKVYVGSGNEFILLSGNDISMIDRFVAAGDDLEALVLDLEQKEKGIGEKEHRKMAELRLEFSQKATEIMDGVLGSGSTRKFFSDVYESIPDFMPDIEAFMDFWDSLIPVIEKLSDHKVKLEKLASRRRMERYQPQDHKKPQRKGTK
ncbi:MAG: hypothetical protein OSJ72_10165 [Lachnospiraceae bacterium]|nr:hypothetical protein [Lachnospiraceae bacterium]